MLLRYGFTTVVDTGSQLANTAALRARIDSGEVPGPRILTAGGPLYPVDGIPYYLHESLPPEIVERLATPRNAEEAVALVREQLALGADIVKLFTGSWVRRGEVKPMDPTIAAAAAEEAHRQGKVVFAHASNVVGLEIALDAGVDVLAHALDDDRDWNISHLEKMTGARMAMVPTLQLFSGPPHFKFILQLVRNIAGAGTQILFGTDVGFLPAYDPTAEYGYLAAAGLSWTQILAALTTEPAARFAESNRRGRVAAGLAADLVLLARDPRTDVKAFADVAYTLRAGQIIYRAAPTE